uniref:Uncharacterized protein n=1 Tax=Rhizophora mucronata TaxID=61149 RepID=A0A2P2MEA1_RHIMU
MLPQMLRQKKQAYLVTINNCSVTKDFSIKIMGPANGTTTTFIFWSFNSLI